MTGEKPNLIEQLKVRPQPLLATLKFYSISVIAFLSFELSCVAANSDPTVIGADILGQNRALGAAMPLAPPTPSQTVPTQLGNLTNSGTNLSAPITPGAPLTSAARSTTQPGPAIQQVKRPRTANPIEPSPNKALSEEAQKELALFDQVIQFIQKDYKFEECGRPNNPISNVPAAIASNSSISREPWSPTHTQPSQSPPNDEILAEPSLAASGVGGVACPFLPSSAFEQLQRDSSDLVTKLKEISETCKSSNGGDDPSIATTYSDARTAFEAISSVSASWKDRSSLASTPWAIESFQNNVTTGLSGLLGIAKKFTDGRLSSKCMRNQLKTQGLLPVLASITNRVAPVAIEASRVLGPSATLGQLLIGGAQASISALAELDKFWRTLKPDFRNDDRLRSQVLKSACDFSRMQSQLYAAIHAVSDSSDANTENRFAELTSEGQALRATYEKIKASETNSWIGCEIRNLEVTKTAARLFSRAATADFERVRNDFTSKFSVGSRAQSDTNSTNLNICGLGLSLSKEFPNQDSRQFPRRVSFYFLLADSQWKGLVPESDRQKVVDSYSKFDRFQKLALVKELPTKPKDIEACASTTSDLMAAVTQVAMLILENSSRVVRERESALERASSDFQRTNLRAKSVAQAMSDTTVMREVLSKVQASFTSNELQRSLDQLHESFLSEDSAFNQLLEFYQNEGKEPQIRAEKIWSGSIEGSDLEKILLSLLKYGEGHPMWRDIVVDIGRIVRRASPRAKPVATRASVMNDIHDLGEKFSDSFQANQKLRIQSIDKMKPLVAKTCYDLKAYNAAAKKYGEVLYILDSLCGSVNHKLVDFANQTSGQYDQFIRQCSRKPYWDTAKNTTTEELIKDYHSTLGVKRLISKEFLSRLPCSWAEAKY